jgi:hypothetical protein
MSDQGSAGQWRPANSHSGPYSEPDEPTGPLPAVSGQDGAASGFPPVSGQPGSWSADDDAPTGGFPSVSTPAEPPNATRRERAPFEPADPTDGPATPESAGPGESDAAAGSGGFPGPAEYDVGPAASGGFFQTGSSFGSEAPAEPEHSFGSTAGFEPVTAPEETPLSSFGPASDAVEPPRAWTEPSGSTPPFGADAPRVAPYDARDAAYGYEVADPSFGPGLSAAPREAGAEAESPGAASDAFSFESLLAQGEGASGPGTPNARQPREDAPPQPFRAPGEAFDAGPSPSPAAGPVSAEDQAAENDFFGREDDPQMWDKVVAPSGPPPQPGKPSSGNLRLPDWMREQDGAGGAGLTAPPSDDFEEEGRSKRPLLAGLGVLVVGLVAAGGAYFLKAGGGSENAAHSTTSQPPKASPSTPGQPTDAQPEKPLAQFKGVHTKPVGRISDAHAGLSYPKLGKPWQMQTQKSAMADLGFSTGQLAVTEKAGNSPKRWGRLLSAQLGGADKNDYNGPGTERAAATQVADSYEARLYAYKHHKKVLASQPLDVDGHKGWLVGYYLTYHRPGVKATGELLTVALIDTGKKAPGVLLMTVPNTDKKLWPDVNFVMHSTKVQ